MSKGQAERQVEQMRTAMRLRDRAQDARFGRGLGSLKLSAKIVHQEVDKKANGK